MICYMLCFMFTPMMPDMLPAAMPMSISMINFHVRVIDWDIRPNRKYVSTTANSPYIAPFISPLSPLMNISPPVAIAKILKTWFMGFTQLIGKLHNCIINVNIITNTSDTTIDSASAFKI